MSKAEDRLALRNEELRNENRRLRAELSEARAEAHEWHQTAYRLAAYHRERAELFLRADFADIDRAIGPVKLRDLPADELLQAVFAMWSARAED